MPRKRKLTEAEVKAAVDRAVGLPGDDAELPLGRPSDYKPEFVEQAKKLCELGATDFEIANFFHITDRTLYRWKLKYPDFCQALLAGKAPADDRVERSMYHLAVGYTFESEKIFQFRGEIVRTKTIEHVPPNMMAGQFWLKNRRADKWREKHEIEFKPVGTMTSEEILAEIRAEVAELGIALPGLPVQAEIVATGVANRPNGKNGTKH